MAQKPREHFGQGNLKTECSKSVFINCPYDQDFAERFDALVFTTVCCGFLPRSALESGSVAEPRMERITRAIFSSKYSIHDLSRCKGEGDESLARFNMPLELGVAMARRYTQTRKKEKHDWLLLVPKNHQYVKFLSDLAGFDPYQYDETVHTLVPKVMCWLATRLDAVSTPDPGEVLAKLPAFLKAKQELIHTKQWGEDTPWADIVLTARKEAPL